MKNVWVSDIKWDTDGYSPKKLNLPKEIGYKNIPDDVTEDEVVDRVSDDYGFCVAGCNIEWD